MGRRNHITPHLARYARRRVRNVETPALSPLGERVARAGAFFRRRGTGEGVESLGLGNHHAFSTNLGSHG